VFEKHRVLDGFETILNCTNGLKINMRGQIWTSASERVAATEVIDDEPHYEVEINGASQLLGRNFLLSATSKHLAVPSSEWRSVQLLYADGNKDHYHPVNTVWKFASDLFVNGEFRYIPGMANYGISKNGIVIDLATGIQVHSNIIKSIGYMGILPKNDAHFKSQFTTVHRCLALAWLDYPHNVDKLDVNHKDGNKLNNKLENLEWVTRTANNLHAVENDQRCYNQRMLVRNALTKEVTEYFSIEECARQLRLNGETIRLRCNKGPEFLYPNYLQFKRQDDHRSWKDFENPTVADMSRGLYKPVIAKHAVTELVHIFDTTSAAAKLLGLKDGIIDYTIKNNSKRPCFGYWFKYRDDPTDFPLLSEEQKYFYTDRTTEKNIGHLGYRITDTATNEVQLVKQHETESSVVNLKLSTVIRYAASQKLYKDKFKIEAISF
jgi:hypothetical protein